MSALHRHSLEVSVAQRTYKQAPDISDLPQPSQVWPGRQKLDNETHSSYPATNSDIVTSWWQRRRMQVTLLLKQRHLFFKLKEIQSSEIASATHKERLVRGRVQWRPRAFCISPFAKAVLCLSSSWSPFLTQFLILIHLFWRAHYIHVNENLLEFPKRFGLTLDWREAGKATAPTRRPTHFNFICSSVLISNTLAHGERRVWWMEK